jgi:hypothetical protein
MCAVAFLGAAERAYAFCTPGEVDICFANGEQGWRTCGPNGQYGPCDVPPPPPPPPIPRIRARPQYKVLTVVYAPPGRQGGNSPSLVSYESGSSWGSSTSVTDAFREQYSVTATVSAGILGTNQGGVGFSFGRNFVDTSTTDIRKTASTTIQSPGPAVDGIDHDRDQIWLWLSPVLEVSLPSDSHIEWEVDDSVPMILQFVYVGWLKNPSSMPANVRQTLENHGITPAEYPAILQADPFASGPIPVDTNRYKPLNTTFPYEPPFAPGDPTPTLSFLSTYSSSDVSSSSVANEYSPSVFLEGEVSWIQIVKLKLKSELKWTWTDTKSMTSSTGTSETARVTVGGPSFAYSGPTNMAVYYDVLYKSFLFVPFEGALLSVDGILSSQSSKDVAGKEVVLVSDGVTHRTFTNARGEFRFFGAPGSRMQLKVDGASADVTPISDTVAIELP